MTSPFNICRGGLVLHLPEALPDETLYSLLARIAVVNGMTDHLQVFRKLFGQKSPTSIIRASNGIQRFCEVTGGTYGSLDAVRSKLTILPLLRHLSFRGNPSKVTWLSGSTFDYSGNTRNEWRMCLECRDEDEAVLGFSYWRRSHQLPTSFFCPTHGKPLRRPIILGRELHDRFWLPHELDVPDAPMPDGLTIKPVVAMALARIGMDVLNDVDEPFPAEVIRDTFWGAIEDRFLLTRAGEIRLRECLNDFYDTTKLDEVEITISKISIRQLLIGLQELKPSVPIQHYVLLVFWLFGTWQSFKEHCKWVATINCPVSYSCTRPVSDQFPKDVLAMRYDYRRVCINFIRDNLNATRADFLDKEYKCFRWLKRNDSEWLERHLPVPPRASLQMDLF